MAGAAIRFGRVYLTIVISSRTSPRATASGCVASSTLRTLHAEVIGHLGKYGVTSPWARDGVGVDVGFEHRNDHEYFQPDAAEQSGLLSGFGSAAL
jgi:hypothetical protein